MERRLCHRHRSIFNLRQSHIFAVSAACITTIYVFFDNLDVSSVRL